MTCRMCYGPDPEFTRNNISYAPSTLPHVDIQIGCALETRSSRELKRVGAPSANEINNPDRKERMARKSIGIRVLI
jgi:hypothetical protein